MKINIELTEEEFIALTKAINPVREIITPEPAATNAPVHMSMFEPGFGIKLKYIGEDSRISKEKYFECELNEWEDGSFKEIVIPSLGLMLKKDFQPVE